MVCIGMSNSWLRMSCHVLQSENLVDNRFFLSMQYVAFFAHRLDVTLLSVKNTNLLKIDWHRFRIRAIEHSYYSKPILVPSLAQTAAFTQQSKTFAPKSNKNKITIPSFVFFSCRISISQRSKFYAFSVETLSDLRKWVIKISK